MKHLFVKWLSALLIAALLLTPVAMMEESGEAPTVILEESTPDVNEEKNCEAEDGAPVNADEGDVDSEDAEETVESDAAIVVEAVDESVAEAGDVELTMLEAQGDGLYIDALEDSAAETADASAMLLGAGGDVDINSSFPDSAFREYVRGFDTSKDGKLSTYERSVVTEIRVVDKGIKDLTGIKLFPNLTRVCF